MASGSRGDRVGRSEAARRIVYVVTHPITARYLLRGQLAHLASAGYDVHLISNPGPELDEVEALEGVSCAPVEMSREIRPWRDLVALVRLTRRLRELRPDLVNASTPKAGVLGIVAATLAGAPARVRLVRGLRLQTERGWRRALLSLAERLSSLCAHRVVLVSESLRAEYLERGLAPAAKTLVLDPGSSNGVDLVRFSPVSSAERRAARRALGLGEQAPVIGFIGRVVPDKGIEDLVRAFDEILSPKRPEARLVVLGDYEEANPVEPRVRRFLKESPRVIEPGWVADSSIHYRAFDVIAFPSYREGFPNVPLEAAACALPVAGYRATGTRDAVVDGVSGTLVPTGDWRALGEAIERYLSDPELARAHGEAGRRRAEEHFANRAVWDRWLGLYASLMI